MRSGIYGIEDVKTGNLYLGSTQKSVGFKKRWSNHKSKIKNGTHTYRELNEAYAEDANRIKYIIFEECSDAKLEERENWWVNHIKKIDGWTVINKNKCTHRKGTDFRENMCKAQRNELNGNSKYSRDQILKILELVLLQGVNRKQVAKEFGMSYNYLNNIISGNKWKSLVREWKKDNLERVS